MKRPVILSITLTLALAAVAFAASVHFKNQRDPRFADGGVVLTASGALAVPIQVGPHQAQHLLLAPTTHVCEPSDISQWLR